MVEPKITLRGLDGTFKGKTWQVKGRGKVGRVDGVEVTIDDTSVSRNHAELVHSSDGWKVQDIGSTNGTILNGVKLGKGSWPIRHRDVLQFGEIRLSVESFDEPASKQDFFLGQGVENFSVHATHALGWDEALKSLPELGSRSPHAGEKMFALMQAGHYLASTDNEDELLHHILQDAVAVLEAQRGAIALLNPKTEELEIKAINDGDIATSKSWQSAGKRTVYSQTLAQQCLKKKSSILYKDDARQDVNQMGSIAEGKMASVMCVLLRTPRRVLGILHLDRGPLQNPFSKDDLRLADALAAQVSSGIECSLLLAKQRELFFNTVTVLAQAVELRDVYTGGHTQRVTLLALLLAEKAGLSDKEIELIRTGTPLHDIGKIGIDDAILRKPGRLTPEETEIMKQHTTKGAAIISLVPNLHEVVPIVRSHHEKWDGKGYPDGLKENNIPLIARVVAVADAFDAMTSDRPYRKGLGISEAIEEIHRGSGSQFDPKLAEIFIGLRPQIAELSLDNFTGM